MSRIWFFRNCIVSACIGARDNLNVTRRLILTAAFCFGFLGTFSVNAQEEESETEKALLLWERSGFAVSDKDYELILGDYGKSAIPIVILPSLFEERRDGGPNSIRIDIDSDRSLTLQINERPTASKRTREWAMEGEHDEIEEFALLARTGAELNDKNVIERRVHYVVRIVFRDGTTYQVVPNPVGDGHVLMEMDVDSMPCCAATTDPSDEAAAKASRAEKNEKFDGSQRILVMVVIDGSATLAAGSASKMRTIAESAIVDVRRSFENVGVSIQFRDIELIDHKIHGTVGAVLSRLTKGEGTEMDSIHKLRDKADLVALIVNDFDDKYEGKAHVMTELSTEFETKAFCVMQRETLIANYTMAHEIGHLFGCCHEKDATEQCIGLCTYSHGFRFDVQGYPKKTLLAVENGRRIKLFSDGRSEKKYGGKSIGNKKADNAKTVLDAAPTVANFRKE